jgi:hypothetical protein
MSSQREFIRWLTERLEVVGIPFMIAGSLASSIHGEPRSTNDIDLVIDPTPEQLERLVMSIENRCYVNGQTACDALRLRSMFNVVDLKSGWKADLIIRKDRPFSRQEFERRKIEPLMGLHVPVVSPEDTILSKLEWSKKRESERQFRDALGVTIVYLQELDRPYFARWAGELVLDDLLAEVLEKAELVKGDNN